MLFVLLMFFVLVTPSSRASSVLSEPPPAKKRRLSRSPAGIYTDSDDSDEEEEPLAARMAQPKPATEPAARPVTGKRTGKKGTGSKKKSSMAPTSLVPPSGSTQAMMNATTNGKAAKYHEPRIRVEEKLDKRQLDRLVTGVTVDTGGQTSAVWPFVVSVGILCLSAQTARSKNREGFRR